MIANSVAGQDAITIIVFIIATNYPLIATSRENSLIQGISIAPAMLARGKFLIRGTSQNIAGREVDPCLIF